MGKLQRVMIRAVPSYVPKRLSGRDETFDPEGRWDYGPRDYIPTVTWRPRERHP